LTDVERRFYLGRMQTSAITGPTSAAAASRRLWWRWSRASATGRAWRWR